MSNHHDSRSSLCSPFWGAGGMLLSYLKAAWRNMQRNPVFAVMNIAGFALAVAACLLALCIALLTVSFQSIKAARSNPV